MVSTQSSSSSSWFATCPRGVERLLVEELQQLGASHTRETIAGVTFKGSQSVAYRACLWSRLSNSIMLPLGESEANDRASIYESLSEIEWGRIFDVDTSFLINFSGTNSHIRDTRFGAQICKDAVVDWYRVNLGRVPPRDRANPEIKIRVRLSKKGISVALDLSGGSLHKRGYRSGSGESPLKENLAAAVLLNAKWPEIAKAQGALIDPMCGSGTLLIEGALMCADVAPAINRAQFGFEKWKGHNPEQWEVLVADARGRAERGLSSDHPEVRGYDDDLRVIRYAEKNIALAGLSKIVRVSCKDLKNLKKPTHKPLPNGLFVCNAPYGKRLGEKDSLAYLYRHLGEVMASEFGGWDAAILTSEAELAKAIRLRSHKQFFLPNGPIDTRLYLFNLRENYLGQDVSETTSLGTKDSNLELDQAEGPFANRVKKNLRRLSGWISREGIECYRLYDADMPEYAVAVDVYGQRLNVSEYKAPIGVDKQGAEARLSEVLQVLPKIFSIPASAIMLKQRHRQRKGVQYQKKETAKGELFSIDEHGAKFLVNLNDYIDTGLFLDHRPLRRRLKSEAKGKDFLNLYSYTGAASIQAALGGSRSTTSVDHSKTYLAWYRKNLAHNGLSEARNKLCQADCQTWLETSDDSFDLILLDPPSFSNSSRMNNYLDIQRDHIDLVHASMARLRENGILYFSTNFRKFEIDGNLEKKYLIEDITKETLDPDFRRGKPIHRCWKISHGKL